jgi:hypothetical protein
VDIRKTILHLKTELRTLNSAIGAFEDSLEQLAAARYQEHVKRMAQPAEQTAAMVMPAPSIFKSIPLAATLLQRLGGTN